MSKVIIRQSATSDPSNAWAVVRHADIYSQYSKVGIGKSPLTTLDVDGSCRVSGTLNPDNLIANDRWSSVNGSIIYNGGNVGIGKTNPSASMDISGSMRTRSNLTMSNSSLIIGGNLDVSNNVTLSLNSSLMTHTHSGNLTAHTVSIPNNQRISRELPFEVSFNDGLVRVLKFNSTYTRLYAGGSFTTITITNRATGLSTTYGRTRFCEIDCLTGEVTTNTSVSSTVWTIEIDSVGDVYIGGEFTTVGNLSVSALRIAKWIPTTQSWTNIGTLNSTCRTIHIAPDGFLYAGGQFSSVTPLTGSGSVQYIARYNPSTNQWTSIASPLVAGSYLVHTLVSDSTFLYVGGYYASLLSTTQICRYNYSSGVWSAMGSGGPSGTEGECAVYSLVIDNSNNVVYAGGAFTSMGGAANTLRFAVWNRASSTWSGFTGTALNNAIYGMCLDPSGRLYIGGGFTDVSGVYRDRVAIRNRTTNQWEGVDAEITSIVFTITSNANNHLFIGGEFTTLVYRYITSTQNSQETLNVGRFASYNPVTRIWSDNFAYPIIYENDTAGNLSVNSISSTSGKLLVGKTSSSRYDSSSVTVDICGGINMTGTILSVDNPYNTLRVYDTNSTENTWSPNLYSSFVYIDLSGRIVGNTTEARNSIFNTSGAVGETLFPITDTDVSFAKVYNTTHNTYAITHDGRIYACGYNEHANCGIGTATAGGESILQRALLRDASNTDISNLRFTKVLISDNYIMTTIYGLTTTGDLYAWGANDDGQLADGGFQYTSQKTFKYPNIVTFNNQIYKGLVKDAVSSGRYYSDGTRRHTVCVLDKYGFVWCAGNGSYGQMGIGTTTENNTTLQKVKTNSTTELSDISAVYSYGIRDIGGFFALANNGDLYVWGRSSSNHILDGVAGDRSITYATKINSRFNNEAVSRIWTTSHDRKEIFVQTVSGIIYGTGYGYALGINSITNAGWVVIDHFNTTTKYVVQIYTDGGASTDGVSDSSTFAITRNLETDNYTLWGTGYNVTTGRLGIDFTGNNIRTWRKVNLPSYIVKSIRRILVCTNNVNTSTVILLNNGRLLFAGRRVPLYNDTTIYPTFTPLPLSSMLNYSPN